MECIRCGICKEICHVNKAEKVPAIPKNVVIEQAESTLGIDSEVVNEKGNDNIKE